MVSVAGHVGMEAGGPAPLTSSFGYLICRDGRFGPGKSEFSVDYTYKCHIPASLLKNFGGTPQHVDDIIAGGEI